MEQSALVTSLGEMCAFLNEWMNGNTKSKKDTRLEIRRAFPASPEA